MKPNTQDQNAQQPAHTPLPWRLDKVTDTTQQHKVYGPKHPVDGGNYAPLCILSSPEDAAFIVRACNAHQDLVNALDNAPVKRMGVETAEQFIERYKAWYRDLRYEALQKATSQP